MITVDARGRSCPEPALLTRNALRQAGSGEVHVLVDTETARDNCTRVARREGWQVQVLEEDGTYHLVLKK